MIRDFIESDREEYIKMSQEFYGGGTATLHPVPVSNFIRSFDECLKKNPYLRGGMVVKDGKIAGFFIISITWSNEAGGLTILLEELFIKEEMRGGGCGKEFFEFIDMEYSDARRLRLEVSQKNVRAIKLYEELGFTRLDYVQMIKERECSYAK